MNDEVCDATNVEQRFFSPLNKTNRRAVEDAEFSQRPPGKHLHICPLVHQHIYGPKILTTKGLTINIIPYLCRP